MFIISSINKHLNKLKLSFITKTLFSPFGKWFENVLKPSIPIDDTKYSEILKLLLFSEFLKIQSIKSFLKLLNFIISKLLLDFLHIFVKSLFISKMVEKNFCFVELIIFLVSCIFSLE